MGICKTSKAHILMLPCTHMSFCRNCLPKQVSGCPACGEAVERVVDVNWGIQPLSARESACCSSQPIVSAVQVPGGLDDCEPEIDAAMERLEQQLMQLRQLKR